MQEIHFSIDDLALTRIRPTVGHLAESIFSMQLLERGGGGALFARWRQLVRRRLGPDFYTLLQVARNARPGTELFLEKDVPPRNPATRRPPRGGKRANLTAAVWDFYQIAVAPYWSRIHRYLETDREFRARTFISSGVDGMLFTLHPRISWERPVLTIANDSDEVIHLDGRGLVLIPSLFLCDRPQVFVDSYRPDAPLVLAYPISLDTASATALWEAEARSDKALGALVGRTRAEVLRALHESCTTSELGRRLDISPAAASQHTAILRGAGLITSHRKFNMVIHTLTPLGSALIKGGELPPTWEPADAAPRLGAGGRDGAGIDLKRSRAG